MSLQVREERRDRSRVPAQGSRREWVPRAPVAVATMNPAPSNYPLDQNVNAGCSDNNVVPPGNQHRSSHGSRGHTSRPVNHRREREKGRNENQVVQRARDSDLPQLLQEIQDKLMKSTVECMICYDTVRRTAPIWSCSSCYSIFHLNCIKKWAQAPTSVDVSAEKNQGFNWRCPGCQSVQLTSSREISYVCFCGKRPDPPSDLYLTPHSCGEPCGKPLEKEVLVNGGRVSKEDLCPHVCVLQCHPGPCPPCKAFAPPGLCPCGKKTITTRCSDRSSVLTCGQVCDKLLECGRHRCGRICHVGLCDPCHVLINASCFCNKKAEVILCGDMAVKGEIKAEGGVFSCGSKCGKELSCGNHVCNDMCHPGNCGECEFLPNQIKTCCCGKTKLEEERHSCLDPIPTCSQVCDKPLPCGLHRCRETCHPGDCSPCSVLVSQKCRCGSTSQTVECYRAMKKDESFTCERSCGRKKNCGRHRCSERCCPLSNPNNRPNGEWDPHFCTMQCGKKLRCGQHACESLCHSGHCPPCLETIFTDLTCACGRTSIPPPLPCGTPPPSCQLPCSVPQPCGHSASHSCHFGDCPPCSVPVAKECVGGHVVLRNIPCGSKDIRCNKLCGKTRRCGLHACGRTCHPPPCDVPSSSDQGLITSCGQICGAPRRDCRHTCTAACHPLAPCPDIRCEFSVTITCSCGRITANVPCGAGGGSGNYNSDSIHEASIIQKLPVPLQPVENSKLIPLGLRKLTCDDECAKLERKKVLADAFDVTTPNLDSLHFGENTTTAELLSDMLRRDPKWVLSLEERCKYLVLGKSKGVTHGLKVHVFCPMLKDKRDAVRFIAERWKLAVNAAGWEPKRFVTVHVTPKSKAPTRVLGVKGTPVGNAALPPQFDPLVDMDPRLVVSFPDLPREADISALVLRFGGECELVWLNDKNALAVFHDPNRAATAMRRLDHGTAYHGAVVVVPNAGASATSSVATNAWGGAGTLKEGGALAALKGNPWKKAVVQEPGWREDSWGDEEWTTGSANLQTSAWTRETPKVPITASLNRWSVLDHESSSRSAAATIRTEPSRKHSPSSSSAPKLESEPSGPVQGNANATEASEVVDDWEQAYE
ncbi:hypothetical protein K1719_023831 [Acacia pycnantha]|nr:hypothetical protein K1719_023831 [Acacia pycnantha]